MISLLVREAQEETNGLSGQAQTGPNRGGGEIEQLKKILSTEVKPSKEKPCVLEQKPCLKEVESVKKLAETSRRG